MIIYTADQVAEKIASMQIWQLKNEAIEKEFVLKDFSAALAFLLQIGIQAEKMNHHPEIFNVYNKVQIRLSTHDAKAITDLDFKLAEKIDGLFDTYYK